MHLFSIFNFPIHRKRNVKHLVNHLGGALELGSQRPKPGQPGEPVIQVIPIRHHLVIRVNALRRETVEHVCEVVPRKRDFTLNQNHIAKLQFADLSIEHVSPRGGGYINVSPKLNACLE